jgi:hypothetical protein
MELIGGILGQFLATLNIIVLVGAHWVVRARARRQEQIQQQQAAEIKRRQLRAATFGKL